MTYKTYLPLIFKPERRPHMLGTQTEARITSISHFLADNAWIHKAIRWFECEGAEPGIEFPNYLLTDCMLIEGRDVVWGTRGCAEYARAIPEYLNSPPKPEYYSSYAEFVIAAIELCNIQHIEIWNEPDTDPHYMAPGHDYYYGGWGTFDEPLSGGLNYGDFLAIIYPLIKQAHPDVMIIAGALACHDKTEPFLAGMTEHGIYDAISFHAYPTWDSGTGAWNMMRKHVEMIRQYTDKPLICTESSLLKYDSITNPEFEEDQADYWDYFVEDAYSLGLLGAFWYDMTSGWRCCNMVNGGRTKPVWYKYYEALK